MSQVKLGPSVKDMTSQKIALKKLSVVSAATGQKSIHFSWLLPENSYSVVRLLQNNYLPGGCLITVDSPTGKFRLLGDLKKFREPKEL